MNIKNKNNYLIESNLIFQNVLFGFFSKKLNLDKKNFTNFDFKNKNLTKKKILIAKKILNLQNTKTKFIKQIHSSKIELIDNTNIEKQITADGSFTFCKNISLAIITADCAPVFLFDNYNKVICALHVGWKGCLKDICTKAIIKLAQYGSKKKNITAIIGPCLEFKNFEVDNLFKKKFINENKNYNIFFRYEKNKEFFNMKEIIKYQLHKNRIKKVHSIDFDTYTNKDVFFSHRRSNHFKLKKQGRMINIIGFKQV